MTQITNVAIYLRIHQRHWEAKPKYKIIEQEANFGFLAKHALLRNIQVDICVVWGKYLFSEAGTKQTAIIAHFGKKNYPVNCVIFVKLFRRWTLCVNCLHLQYLPGRTFVLWLTRSIYNFTHPSIHPLLNPIQGEYAISINIHPRSIYRVKFGKINIW